MRQSAVRILVKGASMITIRDVHKRYSEHDVLNGIDLDIPHAATVTVIGPSGSGKSTPVSYTHLTLPTTIGV